MRIRSLVATLCLSLAVLSAAPGRSAGWAADATSTKPVPGATAPGFVRPGLAGEAVDLSAVVGRSKAVIINFWGLRCAACIEEIPKLNDLYRKYKDAGLEILGVNVDGVGPETVKANLPRIGVVPEYVLVCDAELLVADLFQLAAAPYTVIVNSRGVITYVHEGYKAGDESRIEEQILTLVR